MSSEATQEEPMEEPTDASETPGPLGLPASGAASWRQPEDEKKLIEYLLEHRAEAGDGTNFKATTFRGAATHLLRDWGFVHHIKSLSGFSWSDEHGANISAASQGTWDAWVAVNPKAARFRNKGWPFYDLLAPLMPSKAKGGNVFRAGAPAAAAERSSSPDWDLGALEQESGEKDDGAGDSTSGDDADGPDVGGTADDEPGAHIDKDDNETGSSSPVPSVRGQKCPAIQSSTYRKKPRVSASAQGLVDLTRTAAEFNEIMGSIRDIFASGSNLPAASTASNAAPLNPVPSTSLFQSSPQRHSAAIGRVRGETWLGTSERTALVRILRDIHKVDEYNGVYDEEEMRIIWILEELRAVGVYAYHPKYSSLSLDGFDI
ncbi:hypothetical protein K438DRAFT_2008884 [Mycena galopus ATCC 62051]|nr:hypothetical protein K438DRAFT_2008884 [Mycena galopus ATCC 62051]